MCVITYACIHVCYHMGVTCREVVHGADTDITAMTMRGGALWLGTRNGYLLILDSYLMEEKGDPLLGLQQCGQGKVKCIVPLTPQPNATSKLQVSWSFIRCLFTVLPGPPSPPTLPPSPPLPFSLPASLPLSPGAVQSGVL